MGAREEYVYYVVTNWNGSTEESSKFPLDADLHQQCQVASTQRGVQKVQIIRVTKEVIQEF